ncbi:NAD(P)H-dependent oxidoreductase [Kitasatospora sp. NPDC001527]|uniref:FMN-dependent NADH-azoreductase n=1 Tax=Kitasatospora sp. NPDC001527 TaxID=3154519 RepID=UPI003316D7EE
MPTPMPTLLHLDSSASPADRSVSRRLTARFARAWQAGHPGAGYRYRDLAADPVPLIGAGYASLGVRVERHGAPVPLADVPAFAATPDEHHEWSLTHPLITELHAADTLLLGVPMYNFTVPAALKAWIDRVTFPGAHTGRLTATRVIAVTARGGGYGPGTPREPFDFQTPYLRAWCTEHLGVPEANLRFVHAELTRAADVPALTPYRGLATTSLTTARTTLTTLATA